MIDQLRAAWRSNDLEIALGIVEWGLSHPDSSVRATARDALAGAVQRISERKGAASALTPILARGLLAAAPRIQRRAVIGLQVVAKNGGDLGPALAALGDSLSGEGALTAGVARALWLAGLHRADLGELRDKLEQALTSEQTQVRAYASKALSRYLERAGLETKLEVMYSEAWVVEGGWRYMDGPVSVEASHRRTYAATDQEIADVKLMHLCGVCGSRETQRIYYEMDAGTSWKAEKYEILCEKCARYTVYEYDW